MTYLIVFGIFFAFFFAFGLFSRRKLGVAILALAAGSILARTWADALTPLVSELGLQLVEPPLQSVVSVILTIAPALIVMFRLPKAHGWFAGTLSSFMWALAVVLLTFSAFSDAVVLDDTSRPVVDQVIPYMSLAITACIVFALTEFAFHKKRNPDHEKRGKHKK